MALNTIRQVFFLNEQQRALGFYKGITAVQVSPSDIEISFPTTRDTLPNKVATNIAIEAVKLAENVMVIYGEAV